MEKSREQQNDLYISFIDFTKAFDTVDRPLLFQILSKVGCPPKLIRIIQCMYTNVNARLIIDGELSKSFSYNGGVKQGCKLAPSLFGIYAAVLLFLSFKEIGHEFSIRTDGNIFDLRRLKSKTKVLYEFLREAQYADDIAIMSGTSFGLQTLLTAYHITSKKFGLQIKLCVSVQFAISLSTTSNLRTWNASNIWEVTSIKPATSKQKLLPVFKLCQALTST